MTEIIAEMLLSPHPSAKAGLLTATAAHRWNTKTGRVFLMGNLDTVAEDLGKYLEKQAEKDTLRFITCGSVDDGKST